MFSAFQTFGKLGALASSVARAWSPLALWPNGIATPGMWISPRDLTSEWADYTGTTPVVTPGTVADASNPVGLALDIRAGATVLTDPGLHMLQSTSVDRPLLSARVNLLTGTEQITSLPWNAYNSGNGSALSPITAPDGQLTAIGLNDTSAAGYYGYTYEPVIPTATTLTFSCYVKQGTNTTGFSVWLIGSGTNTFFQGTISWLAGVPTASGWLSEDVGNGWYRISFDFTSGASTGVAIYLLPCPTNSAETGSTYFWGIQLEIGSVTSTYQRVTSASDYNATGFPIAQLYNGTNSGMATAAFAAGTLIDGMDCLIAVRRDSAAATYLISNTGSRGFFEWESGNSGRPDVSAGTPTYYVDGVAVTATKGALFTALTIGDWHILEARGLDLSTWTALEVSSLVSYRLNGPRGDIMLYPSTDSTTDKDAARQWLADYYGVTLP